MCILKASINGYGTSLTTVAVPDQNPESPVPHVFGPPGSGPFVRGMDPDSDPALDPDPSIIKQI